MRRTTYRACIRCPVLQVGLKMLPRLAEIEKDLVLRRKRAEEEQLGQIEGVDLTLTFVRAKQAAATGTVCPMVPIRCRRTHENAHPGTALHTHATRSGLLLRAWGRSALALRVRHRTNPDRRSPGRCRRPSSSLRTALGHHRVPRIRLRRAKHGPRA